MLEVFHDESSLQILGLRGKAYFGLPNIKMEVSKTYIDDARGHSADRLCFGVTTCTRG